MSEQASTETLMTISSSSLSTVHGGQDARPREFYWEGPPNPGPRPTRNVFVNPQTSYEIERWERANRVYQNERRARQRQGLDPDTGRRLP